MIFPIRKRLWELRPPPDPSAVRRVATELGIHPVVASLFLQRFPGNSLTRIHTYLFGKIQDLPFPAHLGDLEKASRILADALHHGVSIGIFGDYDVDGICATALMVKFLKECGAQVHFVLPHREVGYGLNVDAVRRFYGQGVKVLLTLDNGVSAHAAVREAVHLGMKVVICDHHHFDPSLLPPADALVHPGISDQGEWRHACGAGVALSLAIALRRTLREQGFFECREEPVLRHALLFATLGTLADLVSLEGANRFIVREGLKILNQLPTSRNYAGIRALLQVSGVKPGSVDEEAVLFYLAPRLNAAGRVEDARLALDLLLCEDEEEASSIASRLNRLNRYRQETEDQVLKEVDNILARSRDFVRRPFLLLAHPNWHLGVLGIVAGRVAQKYYRPTLLMKIEGEEARGSGRSIPEVNLIEALSAGKAWAEMGGHSQAAGVRLRVFNLKRFREAVDGYLLTHYCPEGWQPRLSLDQELLTSEISSSLMANLELLGPYGVGNPRPLFLSESIQPENVHLLKKEHLRFVFRAGNRRFTAIAFGRRDLLEKVRSPVKMAYRPFLDTYFQKEEIRFQVEDLRAAWI